MHLSACYLYSQSDKYKPKYTKGIQVNFKTIKNMLDLDKAHLPITSTSYVNGSLRMLQRLNCADHATLNGWNNEKYLYYKKSIMAVFLTSKRLLINRMASLITFEFRVDEWIIEWICQMLIGGWISGKLDPLKRFENRLPPKIGLKKL